MKILFTGIFDNLHGGLETFALRAAAALREQGHTVDVIGAIPSELQPYDFVIIQKLPGTLEDLRRLKDYYQDKLHFYAHDHDLYCLRRHYYDPFKRNCDRIYSPFPCRLCAAVTRPQWILRALTRDMNGFLEEMRAVKVFTPSNFTRNILLRNNFNPERMKVLAPFFADPAPVHNQWMPDGTLRLLFMGQVIRGKGLALLIEALKFLDFPCRLTVVGTGKDEAKLRKIAPGNVQFEGWQKDAGRYFASTDICVFPSIWNEPFGLVGVEAMSHGIPSIAFHTGGTSDWLIEGQTGFFAQEKTPKALADTIRKMRDKALLEKLGASSIAYASSHFTLRKFLDELLSF